MNYELAPVALFVYKRLHLTKQAVNALKQNHLSSKTDLYIFSDTGKNIKDEKKVSEVRRFIKKIDGFKSVKIYYSKNNKGLAKSVISGVSKILNKYGKIIVLEDDLITTPNFLDFMNTALVEYEKNDSVKSINGYSLKIDEYPTEYNCDNYLAYRPYSWGWATWKNKWNERIFEDSYIDIQRLENEKASIKRRMGQDVYGMIKRTLSGDADSWYSKWIYYHYITDTLSVYPTKSKVENYGFGDEGTHCRHINVHKIKVDKSAKREFKFVENIKVDDSINNQFLEYFSKAYKAKYRLQLLKSKSGRELVLNEFKERFL